MRLRVRASLCVAVFRTQLGASLRTALLAPLSLGHRTRHQTRRIAHALPGRTEHERCLGVAE